MPISRNEVKNMPNKNGMGPEGKGPKTGRGLGSCNPSNADDAVDNNSRLGRNRKDCPRRGLRGNGMNR